MQERAESIGGDVDGRQRAGCGTYLLAIGVNDLQPAQPELAATSTQAPSPNAGHDFKAHVYA